MIVKTKAIVLKTINYLDTSVVVQLYTEEKGRLSILVNGVRSKKKGKKIMFFQPASMLELDLYYNPKRELQSIKEVNLAYFYQSLPYNPVKSTIALFLCDVLTKILIEEEKNQPLFAFLSGKFTEFDTQKEDIENFHLFFLIQLSHYLGFLPNNNYSKEKKYFDMLNGKFVELMPTHSNFSNQEESKLLGQLLDCSEKNKISIKNHERKILLKLILQFYKTHNENVQNLKSLDILIPFIFIF
ncbi:MAG: DNA repair protein RecO [Bacteroidia bacterium]|nr:MAG: DNA repair protein RecO [Bacteroidia bacterium]